MHGVPTVLGGIYLVCIFARRPLRRRAFLCGVLVALAGVVGTQLLGCLSVGCGNACPNANSQMLLAGLILAISAWLISKVLERPLATISYFCGFFSVAAGALLDIVLQLNS